MEREQITINGMEFRAERLMPNYQGKYDCICENCIFDADWVDFGKDSPCMKVKCMRNDGHNGNRNVWAAAGDRDLLKRKPVTWWVSFSYTYEYLDGNGEWDSDSGCDARRFLCQEEEIEKKVVEYVKEELDYDNGDIRNIKIEIEDHYITTDYEV